MPPGFEPLQHAQRIGDQALAHRHEAEAIRAAEAQAGALDQLAQRFLARLARLVRLGPAGGVDGGAFHAGRGGFLEHRRACARSRRAAARARALPACARRLGIAAARRRFLRATDGWARSDRGNRPAGSARERSAPSARPARRRRWRPIAPAVSAPDRARRGRRETVRRLPSAGSRSETNAWRRRSGPSASSSGRCPASRPSRRWRRGP